MHQPTYPQHSNLASATSELAPNVLPAFEVLSRPHLREVVQFHAAEIFPASCTNAASDSLSLTRTCMISSVPAHPPHVVHKPYHRPQVMRSILGQKLDDWLSIDQPAQEKPPSSDLSWRGASTMVRLRLLGGTRLPT